MSSFSPTAHPGHNHGILGEAVEALFARTPLPENWQEFLSHFLIDTLYIFLLLLLVMTAVYFLSGYIPMDALHRRLAQLKSLPGFALALAAGVLSPFCSCSIIPILIGLLSVGVPVSVCLCYLTASSLLNLTALLSLFGVTGAGFTGVYILCALGIIAASSLIFSLLRLDSTVKNYTGEHHHHHEEKICGHCVWHRLRCALLSTLGVFKRCALFILLGVLLSSAVTAFFPLESISRAVNENGFLSAAAVSLIGFPIHSDVFSISPVLTLLLSISPAAALAFALSTMALSVPSIVILTRALQGRTVAVYCGVIVLLTLAASFLCALLL